MPVARHSATEATREATMETQQHESEIREEMKFFYADIYKAAQEGLTIERISQLYGTTPRHIADILRDFYGVK
jgi:hypothetical protein